MKAIVVGGGAAGMTAAIVAARRGRDVTILEANREPGKKILATGNGRCNFTNRNLSVENYHGENEKFSLSVIHRFDNNAAVEFFEGLGVLSTSLESGRVYPATFDAKTVNRALRVELDHLGVPIVTDSRVVNIIASNLFEIMTVSGKVYRSDVVVLATGGKCLPSSGSDGSGYALAEQLGHSIVPVAPGIVPLALKESWPAAVSGVKCDARLSVIVDGKPVAVFRGDTLFADYGITGTAVIQISGAALAALRRGRCVQLAIDFLPDVEKNGEVFVEERCRFLGNRRAPEFLTGLVPEKLIPAILIAAEIDVRSRAAEWNKAQRKALAVVLKSWTREVTGPKPGAEGQVSVGGVRTGEVNPRTMESKIKKGLYLVGELLDVDGDCGGYNLQWAWSSGYVCGCEL